MPREFPVGIRKNLSMCLFGLWQTYAPAWFKKFLPNLNRVLNRKLLAGSRVNDYAGAGQRVYMLPFCSLHMFCPHCHGAMPTHDVLAALRPNGFVQRFLAEDGAGTQFIIRETDYNPAVLRMSAPRETGEPPIYV